jgi:phosphoglucomutase
LTDKSQGTSGPQEGEGIMKENYLNNFVQATLMPSRFPDRPSEGSLLIGGDGQYNDVAIQTIIQMWVSLTASSCFLIGRTDPCPPGCLHYP